MNYLMCQGPKLGNTMPSENNGRFPLGPAGPHFRQPYVSKLQFRFWGACPPFEGACPQREPQQAI